MEERIANREQLFEDILKSMQLRVPVVVDDDDDDDKNKVWVEVPPEDEKWNQLLKYDEKGETAETFDTVTIDELRKAFQLKKYHTRPHFWNCPRARAMRSVAKRRMLLSLNLLRKNKGNAQAASTELSRIIKIKDNVVVYNVTTKDRCDRICAGYVYLHSKSSNNVHRQQSEKYLSILEQATTKCPTCLNFVRGVSSNTTHTNDATCTLAKEKRKYLNSLAYATLDADMPDPEICHRFEKTEAKRKKAKQRFLKLLSDEKRQQYTSDEEGSDEEGSDEEGSDEEAPTRGSDEEGSDEEGSDEEGSDEEGSDEEGSDEEGSDKKVKMLQEIKRQRRNKAKLDEAGKKGHKLKWRYNTFKRLYDDGEDKVDIKGNAWVYAKKSDTHGIGLFAKKNIPKGTLIKEFKDWKEFGEPIKFNRGKLFKLTKSSQIHLDDLASLKKAGEDIQIKINDTLQKSWGTIKRCWNSLEWDSEATKQEVGFPDTSEGFGVHPYVMHPNNDSVEGQNEGNVYLQVLKNNLAFWQNMPLFDPVNKCWGLINFSENSPNVEVLSNPEKISGSLLVFNTGGALKAKKDISIDTELLWDYGGKGFVQPKWESIIKNHQKNHLHGGKEPLLVVKMLDGDVPKNDPELLRPVALQLHNMVSSGKNAKFRLYKAFDTRFDDGKRHLQFDQSVGQEVQDLTPVGLADFLAEVCLCATYETRKSVSSISDFDLENARRITTEKLHKSFQKNRGLATEYCQDVLRRFGVEESLIAEATAAAPNVAEATAAAPNVAEATAAAPKVADTNDFWLVPTFYAFYDDDNYIERVVAKMCFCTSDNEDWCVVVFEARRI